LAAGVEVAMKLLVQRQTPKTGGGRLEIVRRLRLNFDLEVASGVHRVALREGFV
jgi:hypothetical protein